MQGYYGHQLADDRRDIPWLWHGFLAQGNITLLTSQWKSGKTTLISILLARLKAPGALAGLAVAPAHIAVLSEESRLLWGRRHDRLDLAHVDFVTQPFKGKPSQAEWSDLIDHVAWPSDFPCPSEATLWRWLSRAVDVGLLHRQGTGRRSDPFRYWLPQRELLWQKDPLYMLTKLQAESKQAVERSLAGGI